MVKKVRINGWTILYMVVMLRICNSFIYELCPPVCAVSYSESRGKVDPAGWRKPPQQKAYICYLENMVKMEVQTHKQANVVL